MQIVAVELLNDNALELLQLLEQLKIIKLAPKTDVIIPSKKQWAGSISKESAAKMLRNVEQLRNEWERTS